MSLCHLKVITQAVLSSAQYYVIDLQKLEEKYGLEATVKAYWVMHSLLSLVIVSAITCGNYNQT